MSALLTVSGLNVHRGDRHILRDLSFSIGTGELHVIMGPNGSGKSTLAQTICGHAECVVMSGTARYDDADLFGLPTYERARKGIVLAFQHPPVVPGISIASLLWAAQKAKQADQDTKSFLAALRAAQEQLGLPQGFADRSVNDGFSGGEQKKSELLQLIVLAPRLAIIDEPDSGLDVDALKVVGATIGALRDRGTAIVAITHNPRLLGDLRPDGVHVLINGCIVRTGGAELMHDVEQRGYGPQTEEHGTR